MVGHGTTNESRLRSDLVEKIKGENGGPCRGRTYGPLIKSVKRPIFVRSRCCEGFPTFA